MVLSSTTVDFVNILVFFVLGIMCGGLTEWFLNTMGIPIPYTVIVFCEGLGFAALQLYLYPDLQESFETPVIGADLIVFIFLPILLFGEVKGLNWHRVKSGISQSMILAGPGAFISCMLTSLFIKILLPHWPWSISFLFGAVLCATDPVSVVSLLKTSGASNRLTILIVGESLMNDGAAMILFFFFYNYIESPDTPYTPITMLLFILRMLVISPAFGCTIGLISTWVMKKAYQTYSVRDMNFYISVTLITAYVSFVFAQSESYLACSGVLSCCGAGLMLSWLGSPKIMRDHKMEELWENLEWICNTLIFLLAGVIAGIIAGKLHLINWASLGYLFAIFASLNVIRLLLVFVLYPLLIRVDNGNGLKVTVNDALFITWGGVRGALGISLALIVQTCLGGNGTCPTTGDEDIGNEFFLYVGGVAGLSLLINGTFSAPVLQWLGLVGDPNAKKSPDYKYMMAQVKRGLRSYIKEEMDEIRKEIGSFDPGEVERLCQLMRRSIVSTDDPLLSSLGIPRTKVSSDILEYVRTTFLETVRARYLDSIQNEKIGTHANTGQLLLYSIDVAIDKVTSSMPGLGDFECIEQNLTLSERVYNIAYYADSMKRRLGKDENWVSWIDAVQERRAMYVLINFIDAHQYAAKKLHMFLGNVDEDSGTIGPEETYVLQDSSLSVSRAKELLSKLDQRHVSALYSKIAARVILQKQEDLIKAMIKEGAISEKNAASLLDTISTNRDKVDIERESLHKEFISESMGIRVKENSARLTDLDSNDRESFGISPPKGSFRESLSMNNIKDMRASLSMSINMNTQHEIDYLGESLLSNNTYANS